jgi:xanthine dehydrogenase accessory factor
MSTLKKISVGIRGGGDIASGVAWRLHQCGLRVFITELEKPLAVRRKVAFSEAVYEGKSVVEGVEAVCIADAAEVPSIWSNGGIPVLVDPGCQARDDLKPEVMIDAILAKKNLGSSLCDAPLVIALGPGFHAGRDAHFVVETNRGHSLGRLISAGSAEPNTGSPGPVMGMTEERVIRSPVDGIWQTDRDIGEPVKSGDLVGSVASIPVRTAVKGIIRGLIRSGIRVAKGLKIGDIDPRGRKDYCYSVSDKALAIAGGVLEGILRVYGFNHDDQGER